MSNTFNMARLDFYTLKSQTAMYFIIPVIAVFFSMTGSPLSVLGFTAAWLVLLVNTNLFAIQENMDWSVYIVHYPSTRKVWF